MGYNCNQDNLMCYYCSDINNGLCKEHLDLFKEHNIEIKKD